MLLRKTGERETLRRLKAARRAGAGVVVDTGDDAAVLRLTTGAELVATADAFVEGRHYLAAWSDPAAVGARLAAANLSDLAAMAARPRWALLSLGVRADHTLEALLELQGGLARALAADGAAIAGGNLTAVEGPMWLSLSLLGEVEHGRAWTRHGARPGDLVAVTGRPGRAGAGLELATRLGAGARESEWAPLLAAWLEPASRVPLARSLAKADGVTAAIDISDGFTSDLGRLCEASGVGVRLDERAFPEDGPLERAAVVLGAPLRELRLGVSDDYELLMAVDPDAREACAATAAAQGVTFSFVGRFTDSPGVLELDDGGGQPMVLAPAGFDHFTAGA